jgi:branched-subunit amino acid ABC-type transport system permease component
MSGRKFRMFVRYRGRILPPPEGYALATAIAVAILGLAAVFQATRTSIAPADGGSQLLFAFEAVIIGGMGSIWGAFFERWFSGWRRSSAPEWIPDGGFFSVTSSSWWFLRRVRKASR